MIRPPEPDRGEVHHATVVAIEDAGVIILGSSGAGKSDLALRLIAAGAELVADDCVHLLQVGPDLVASAPAAIAGRIEARGLGLLSMGYRAWVAVRLIVRLVPAAAIERLPERSLLTLAGVALPVLDLDPFEASAVAKLLHAVRTDIEPPLRPSGLSAGAASGAQPRFGCKDNPMSDRDPPALTPAARPSRRPALLLVTGLSGAGRSSALKILEDLGYEAVDNLPLSLLPRLVGSTGEAGCGARDGASDTAAARRPLAVGIDIRTRDFAVLPLLAEIDALRLERAIPVALLFLDCDDEILARRFTETRRRHPLAGDRPVGDGIRLERERVLPLRARADMLIDTTELKLGDLKRVLGGYFGLADHPPLTLFVTSFSFRQGLPREADLVFDVRFLDNPHYDVDLRPLSGRDPPVGAFIERDPGYAAFWDGITKLLRPLLPRYDQEGKSYLTIAIGCTGGRHRSVFVAERLATWLRQEGLAVTLAHRDLREQPSAPHPGFEALPVSKARMGDKASVALSGAPSTPGVAEP